MQEIRMDANSDDDDFEGFNLPAITAAEERNRVHVYGLDSDVEEDIPLDAFRRREYDEDDLPLHVLHGRMYDSEDDMPPQDFLDDLPLQALQGQRFQQTHDDAWLPPFNAATDPTRDMSGCMPIEFFELFMGDWFVEHITQETNRYQSQFITANPNPKHNACVRKWKDVTTSDMRAFFAILLLIGLDQRGSYASYCTMDPLLELKGVRNIMPYDRFKLIMQFVHMNDNTTDVLRDHP